MTVNFQYQPRIAEVLDSFNLPEDVKFDVIALMEKRDRELEDYLSKTVNATLDARLTAVETVNTNQTTSINTLNAEFAPGLIFPYGGTSAPTGYLLCDGAAVSRSTYAALFAILSTTYGAGDASTTFNVPDLRGRFPLGKATSGTGSTLGGTGGSIDHTHTASPTTGTPSATVPVFSDGLSGTPVATSTHTHTVSITTSATNPPFQTVNYIVKV